MSQKFKITEDVAQLIKTIITKHKLEPVHEVKYQRGCGIGENYASQTVAVTITTSNGALELFLKCVLNVQSPEALPMDKFCANEVFFYDIVHPAYLEFLKQHGRARKDDYHNIPKCYGVYGKTIVALENLKERNFVLFPKNQIMDDEHVRLVLKTFAKFHALSYAFKDQNYDDYKELEANTFDFLSTKNGENSFITVLRGTVRDFIKNLDPIADEDILAKCEAEALISCVSSADRNLDEFSILTQGDCWSNNMMFLYNDADPKTPIDMMLIDWQLLRPASPVYDISYFFLTITQEDLLNKTEEFLKIYHDELGRRIRDLGSDPDQLYPFAVFMEQWKKYCKFGFALGIFIIKGILSKEDEILDWGEVDLQNVEKLENTYSKYDNQDEYMRRMKVLARYLIKNDYL